MEIRKISGQVVAVGQTEVEITLDGFRGPRILSITDDMPDGFRSNDATFTATVPATALQYDAAGLKWSDFTNVEFDVWDEY